MRLGYVMNDMNELINKNAYNAAKFHRKFITCISRKIVQSNISYGG